MFAAAFAALLLAANDPAPPAASEAPAQRERAAAQALCRDFDAAKEVFAACVRAMLRDSPERRAFGEAYAWAHTLVDPEGWTVRASGADRVNLTKAAGGPPPTPRAWLRTENRQDAEGATYASGLWLYEFDCAGVRMRNLQSTLYAANNLQGEAQTVTLDMPKWEYANPNSIGDILMRELCPPGEQAAVAPPAAADPQPKVVQQAPVSQQASVAQPLPHPDPR